MSRWSCLGSVFFFGGSPSSASLLFEIFGKLLIVVEGMLEEGAGLFLAGALGVVVIGTLCVW